MIKAIIYCKNDLISIAINDEIITKYSKEARKMK